MLRTDLEGPRCGEQRGRIRLLDRQCIAAIDEVESAVDAGGFKQSVRVGFTLVGYATDSDPGGPEGIERFVNLRIQAARTEESFAIAGVEREQRGAKLGVVRRSALMGCRQRFADERLDAISDPARCLRQARSGQPDRVQRLAEAAGEIRRRIDERAVEVECYEAVAAQNTRVAISAGAASKASSSLSSLSSVNEAPAISSEVQYSPT